MAVRWRGGDGRAGYKALGRDLPGGATPAIALDRPGLAALSSRSSPLARQPSRSPPSAYKRRSSAVRPGGPKRSRTTRTSIRWPTTSRPSRIQARRLSSSLRAATWLRTPARADGRFGGSRTMSPTPARRASAANRPKRSAMVAPDIPAPSRGRAGRSRSSRSTVRSWRRVAAIANACSVESGVRTTSHSSPTPRVTASTGSRHLARSR